MISNWDDDGWGYVLHDGDPVAEMIYPMRCKWCATIHDVSKVKVVQRYSDCSTWRCPGCKGLIDDRPLSMGGSATKVRP